MKFMSTIVLILALSAIPARAQIIERVLVKVNGDIFTQTELEERQTAAIRARLGTDLKPEMVNDNAELKKVLDEVTPQLLVDAIDELLLLQEAGQTTREIDRFVPTTPDDRDPLLLNVLPFDVAHVAHSNVDEAAAKVKRSEARD